MLMRRGGKGKGLGEVLISLNSMSPWHITGLFCSPNISEYYLLLVCCLYFSRLGIGLCLVFLNLVGIVGTIVDFVVSRI